MSSGIPSAERCMMEWKGRIFTSANPGLEKQVGHVFLPAVQRRIQTWLDKQAGFPALGAQTEYSFYCENCYPLSDDRRAYFQKLVKAAKPSYGYRLLVLLAEAGVFDSVWTTNFDSLSAVASVGTGVTSIEVGLDTTGRVDRLPRKGELLCVSMHGDYRRRALVVSSRGRHHGGFWRSSPLEVMFRWAATPQIQHCSNLTSRPLKRRRALFGSKLCPNHRFSFLAGSGSPG